MSTAARSGSSARKWACRRNEKRKEQVNTVNITINTNNCVIVTGNIVNVHVYGGGKAANIVIGLSDPEDKTKKYFKYFSKEMFELLCPGMPVRVFGHISSNVYTDKDGTQHFRDNNDLIADIIEILESKTDSQQRRLDEIYRGCTEEG